LAIQTALTLADKIVELYSSHAQKDRKIQKEDFDNLQQMTKQLRDRLDASRDLGNLVYVLRQAEAVSGHAGHIKDQFDWEEVNYDKWGANQKLISDAVWEFIAQSLKNLLDMTSDIEHNAFTLLTPEYRARYGVYTLKASGLARSAVNSQEWGEVRIEIGELHQQFEDLVSAIFDDVKVKTESLVGQALPT